MSATANLVPILVDCSARGANKELRERFGVSGYPTVLFLDPSGAKVGELGSRDPPAVLAELNALLARFAPAAAPARRPAAPRAPGAAPPSSGSDLPPSAPGARVQVADATLDEGLERARTEGHLLAVVFADPEERAREAQTRLVIEALRARGMDQLPERFTWIRRPVCDELGATTREADAYRAGRSPTVVLLDPWAQVPAGQRRSALGRCDDLKQIRAALQAGVVEAARASHPPRR